MPACNLHFYFVLCTNCTKVPGTWYMVRTTFVLSVLDMYMENETSSFCSSLLLLLFCVVLLLSSSMVIGLVLHCNVCATCSTVQYCSDIHHAVYMYSICKYSEQCEFKKTFY